MQRLSKAFDNDGTAVNVRRHFGNGITGTGQIDFSYEYPGGLIFERGFIQKALEGDLIDLCFEVSIIGFD